MAESIKYFANGPIYTMDDLNKNLELIKAFKKARKDRTVVNADDISRIVDEAFASGDNPFKGYSSSGDVLRDLLSINTNHAGIPSNEAEFARQYRLAVIKKCEDKQKEINEKKKKVEDLKAKKESIEKQANEAKQKRNKNWLMRGLTTAVWAIIAAVAVSVFPGLGAALALSTTTLAATASVLGGATAFIIHTIRKSKEQKQNAEHIKAFKDFQADMAKAEAELQEAQEDFANFAREHGIAYDKDNNEYSAGDDMRELESAYREEETIADAEAMREAEGEAEREAEAEAEEEREAETDTSGDDVSGDGDTDDAEEEESGEESGSDSGTPEPEPRSPFIDLDDEDTSDLDRSAEDEEINSRIGETFGLVDNQVNELKSYNEQTSEFYEDIKDATSLEEIDEFELTAMRDKLTRADQIVEGIKETFEELENSIPEEWINRQTREYIERIDNISTMLINKAEEQRDKVKENVDKINEKVNSFEIVVEDDETRAVEESIIVAETLLEDARKNNIYANRIQNSLQGLKTAKDKGEKIVVYENLGRMIKDVKKNEDYFSRTLNILIPASEAHDNARLNELVSELKKEYAKLEEHLEKIDALWEELNAKEADKDDKDKDDKEKDGEPKEGEKPAEGEKLAEGEKPSEDEKPAEGEKPSEAELDPKEGEEPTKEPEPKKPAKKNIGTTKKENFQLSAVGICKLIDLKYETEQRLNAEDLTEEQRQDILKEHKEQVESIISDYRKYAVNTDHQTKKGKTGLISYTEMKDEDNAKGSKIDQKVTEVDFKHPEEVKEKFREYTTKRLRSLLNQTKTLGKKQVDAKIAEYQALISDSKIFEEMEAVEQGLNNLHNYIYQLVHESTKESAGDKVDPAKPKNRGAEVMKTITEMGADE